MKHATVLSPALCDMTIRANNNSVPCTAVGHGARLSDWLTPGSLLVYIRMLRLPQNIYLDGRCYGYWRILDSTCASALQQVLVDSEWQFFRMEPLIDVRAVGRDDSSALASALRKGTKAVETDNLNALEILRVEFSRRLGLHSARLVGVARHIQEGRRYDHGRRNSSFKPVERQSDMTGGKSQ